MSYIKITDIGEIYRVVETEREITLTDSFYSSLIGNFPQYFKSVMTGDVIHPSLGNHPVHCAKIASTGHTTWTVELPYLTLNTGINVDEDSVITPNFEDEEAPFTSMQWAPPAGMRILWAVTVFATSSRVLQSSFQHMVAVSDVGEFYKMPISNTYDDCKLCSGDFDSSGTSHYQVLTKCYTQLIKSRWQGDLFSHQSMEQKKRSSILMRFKASEKDGLEQLPPKIDEGKSWKNYADKVSTEWLTSYVLSK